jgi:hypothetical protein
MPDYFIGIFAVWSTCLRVPENCCWNAWPSSSNELTASDRGGMSVRASCAASSSEKEKMVSLLLLLENWTTKSSLTSKIYNKFLQFLSWYSMAALRLNASTKAVSCRTLVLPTLRTSIPSVVMPTLSSNSKWNLLYDCLFRLYCVWL